eukprot:g1695.t1
MAAIYANQRQALPASALLLVLLLAAYQPLFEGEWKFMKTWDDDSNYLRDESDLLFTSLEPERLWRMLTTIRINVYEPAAWLFKAVVYAACGLDARSFRIASLLVHWLNSCLIASMSQTLLEVASTSAQPSHWHWTVGSFVGAALFAVHPLHCEVIGCLASLVPSVLVMGAMLAVTVFANEEGDDEEADTIVVPQGLPRLLKASAVVCSSLARLVWPVGLRPHYTILPRDLTLSLAVVAGTDSSPAAGPGSEPDSGVGSASGECLCALCWVVGLTLVLVAGACCYLADSAMVMAQAELQVEAKEDGAEGAHEGELEQEQEEQEEQDKEEHEGAAKESGQGQETGEEGRQQQGAARIRTRMRMRMVSVIGPPIFGTTDPTPTAGFVPIIRTSTSTMLVPVSTAGIDSVALLGGWLFFLGMHVPTCGLVQHGMVSLGADRYSYLPDLAIPPLVAGWVCSRLAVHAQLEKSGRARAQRAQRAQRAAAMRTKKQGSALSVAAEADEGWCWRWCWWLLERVPSVSTALLVCTIGGLLAALSSMSHAQVRRWRDDDVMWRYSLNADSADWRIYDQMAEYLMKTGRAGECPYYWEHALEHAPPRETGLKSMLHTAKLLIFLKRADEACELYKKGVDNPLFARSAHVHNNAGICLMKEGATERAMVHFKKARDDCGKLPSMYNAKSIHNNVKLLEGWDGHTPVNVKLIW